MTHRSLLVAVAALAAMTSLPACGGQPSATAVPRVAAFPMAHGQGRALLYVVTNGPLNVYTYPRGSLVGSLGTGGANLCSDRFGDVFVTSGTALTISEYAHGAVIPKVTLQDPYYAGACAVDPTTGSLAVTIFYNNVVVIFPYNKRNGWRPAKTYAIPGASVARFCDYDPRGDLFVNGEPSSASHVALYELPKGSNTFESISLDQSMQSPGGVEWRGKYLSVADGGLYFKGPVTIYRFAIKGASGTKIGSTRLVNSYGYSQYFIQGDRVIGNYVGNTDYGAIGLWAYPGGGSALKVFAPDTHPASVTVSLP